MKNNTKGAIGKVKRRFHAYEVLSANFIRYFL